MDNTVISTEKTEISVRVQLAFLFRGSYRGSWTEPIWAKGTPLIGEGQLSLSCETSGNLEGLTEKLGILGPHVY